MVGAMGSRKATYSTFFMSMKISGNYLQGFDDLNILLSSVLVESNDAKELAEDIESFLLTTYAKASQATDDDIDELHELDVARMFEVLDQKIGGKTYADRLTEHYNEGDAEGISVLPRIYTIINTARA